MLSDIQEVGDVYLCKRFNQGLPKSARLQNNKISIGVIMNRIDLDLVIHVVRIKNIDKQRKVLAARGKISLNGTITDPNSQDIN